MPGRALDRTQLEKLIDSSDYTLPRDNPIKDFLIDADKKFAQFKQRQPETSVLIIVWDDFIYEPFTVLSHENCGLLTPNSYLKDNTGAVVHFSHIDAVVLVRHLTYLYRATTDQPLDERAHALYFGDDQSLPNIIIPVADLTPIPGIIRGGLRALPLDSEIFQRTADYYPKDIVFRL